MGMQQCYTDTEDLPQTARKHTQVDSLCIGKFLWNVDKYGWTKPCYLIYGYQDQCQSRTGVKIYVLVHDIKMWTKFW